MINIKLKLEVKLVQIWKTNTRFLCNKLLLNYIYYIANKLYSLTQTRVEIS